MSHFNSNMKRTSIVWIKEWSGPVIFIVVVVVILKNAPLPASVGGPQHSPGLHWSPRGCWLCAYSPLRVFTSTDAFDLCKFLTFSPTETGIQTIFKLFSVLLAFRLFSHEESLRASNQPALRTWTASEDHFPFSSSSMTPWGPSWVLSPWLTHSSCTSPCMTGPNNVCFPQHTVGFPDLLCTVSCDGHKALPMFCSCLFPFLPTPHSFLNSSFPPSLPLLLSLFLQQIFYCPHKYAPDLFK